ncbi:MAG: hypothetical protein N4A54_06540 [Peptostreptococcaceae bacterium]|jgi:hypothetical protein|nr:hypothetical protein [Peptostreptococcaceae bacterium]
MENKDDIAILREIKANKKEKKNKEIQKNKKENEVFIDGNIYELVDGYFYDDKLYMQIPKDFQDMKDEIKDIKYPNIHRPEIIKTNKTSEIDITFKIIDQEIIEDSVYELTIGMKNMLKNLNPSNIFISQGLKKINLKNIGFLELKTTAIDGFLYNLMFFMVFEGKVLIGKIACIYDDYKTWKELGFKMIDSIKIMY